MLILPWYPVKNHPNLHVFVRVFRQGDMLEIYNGAGIGRDAVGGQAEGEAGCVEPDSTGGCASGPERSPRRGFRTGQTPGGFGW